MKVKKLILFLCFISMPWIVQADEVFFTNNNGVALTKKEYDYVVTRFNEHYSEIMTEKDYKNLIDDEFLDQDIQIVENNPISPLGLAEHTTGSKSLKMTSVCSSSTCSITITLEWLKSAKVRSYDVIGAYLKDVSLLKKPETTIYSSNGVTVSSETVYQNDGFGTSVKLPLSGEISIYQLFNVTPGGTIYGSYQHATSSISLANSKKYTISIGGYGGVFLFDKSIRNIYDAMGGVNLSI